MDDCNRNLSSSVGTISKTSSALSVRSKPAPAYVMTPTPIKTRILGLMARYDLLNG